jgi:hypothetical protein
MRHLGTNIYKFGLSSFSRGPEQQTMLGKTKRSHGKIDGHDKCLTKKVKEAETGRVRSKLLNFSFKQRAISCPESLLPLNTLAKSSPFI